MPLLHHPHHLRNALVAATLAALLALTATFALAHGVGGSSSASAFTAAPSSRSPVASAIPLPASNPIIPANVNWPFTISMPLPWDSRANRSDTRQ